MEKPAAVKRFGNLSRIFREKFLVSDPPMKKLVSRTARFPGSRALTTALFERPHEAVFCVFDAGLRPRRKKKARDR
jgi:hypothetical protein